MTTPRFVTKIVGGKLVTVPEYSDLSSSRQSGYSLKSTYPWATFEPVASHKIGSRTYPVLPPISNGRSDHGTSESELAQRVTDALANVSKQKLLNVKHKFSLLDKDRSGRITTEELRQVFLNYQIFILGPTLMALVKKFEVDGGGVLHEPLATYLLDCHSSVVTGLQDKQKLSAVGLSNPVRVNTGQSGVQGDGDLLLEVENQLIKNGGNWDYSELKTSFQHCDKGRTGFIGNKELKMLCKHHNLPLSRSLLEKLLARFDTDGDGWVNWREFSRFIEKAMSVVALGNSLRSGEKAAASNRNHSRTSAAVKKHNSSLTASTETQTSSEPDPVKLTLRGRNIYLYPPDGYLDMDISPHPPEEELQLEWVYGYRGRDCRNNLFVLSSGELIYFTAAVVVLYDVASHKQRHYTQHTDDIKSLCVHPDGVTVASGQVKGHGNDAKPHIRVWDSSSLDTICVIGVDYFEDAVFALAFSNKRSQGEYLASVEDNEYHTVTVWDWTRKKKITSARGNMNQILAMSFSPFDSRQFVTCGKQHQVTFWELEDNKLKQSRGRMSKNHRPKYVSCIAFSANGDVLTGDTDGAICVWPEESNQVAEELGVRNAHSGSVYALLVLPNGVILSGGGGESTVRAWSRGPKLVPTNVELKMPREVSGVRSLALGTTDHHQLYIGTVDNNIWCTSLNAGSESPLVGAGAKLVKIMEGHCQDLRGLAAHPSFPMFVTAGNDKIVRLWNAADRRVVWTNNKLASALQAAAFHPDGSSVAVGFKKGGWMLLNSTTGNVILERKSEPPETISEIQFSPDGSHIAVGCHDNDVYIYELQNGGKSVSLKARCKGHTSSVSHLDWSKDGEKLQSTSRDYELLFWNPLRGEQITQAESMRNTEWATHNCVLGYPVIGIWPDGADGTDVNSVDRSKGKQLVATGDDFGNVNLYRYPCVSEKAKPRIVQGHSAHVMNVRFLSDDTRLISVGGRDASTMQWKVVKSA